MATRPFVGDSGAIARLPRRMIVGDSGGVARVLRRAFVGDSGGVARLVFSGRTFFVYTGPVTDSNVGSPSLAGVSYDANGLIYESIVAGSTNVADWTDPASAGIGSSGGFYIRADVTSGAVDVSSSATGVDLALSSTRGWFVQQLSVGTNNATLLITLKDGSGGATLASDSIVLSAQVS